jgi:hypothetical protein
MEFAKHRLPLVDPAGTEGARDWQGHLLADVYFR